MLVSAIEGSVSILRTEVVAFVKPFVAEMMLEAEALVTWLAEVWLVSAREASVSPA